MIGILAALCMSVPMAGAVAGMGYSAKLAFDARRQGAPWRADLAAGLGLCLSVAVVILIMIHVLRQLGYLP